MKSVATKFRERPAPVLMIGYGNPLRGDDGLGRAVAEKLIEQSAQSDIKVIRSHQLTPEIVESLHHAMLVIFVDAACDVLPGFIQCRPIASESNQVHSIGHHLTPEKLLSYAQILYGHIPEAWTLTVGGEVWDYGDSLSPRVSAAVPKVLRRIDMLIAARLPAALTAAGV